MMTPSPGPEAAPPNTIISSAPGKAFICGEYAALRGAPAIVMAVDRTSLVRCTLKGEQWRIEARPGGVRLTQLHALLSGVPDGDLLAAVAQAVERYFPDRLPQRVTLDSDYTALCGPNGQSLGLGSSAASSAALTGALLAAAECNASAPQVIQVATLAHRSFQGGRGSGYDVVTAVTGGFCIIRGTDSQPESCRLPPDLTFRLVCGGEAVSTASVLRRLASSAGDVSPLLTRLDVLSYEGEDAVCAGDSEALLNVLDQYRLGVARLGQHIGVSLVTPRTHRLASALEALGATCKPSGAGGDELVLIATPSDHVKQAERCAHALGFQLLRVSATAAGLRITGANSKSV